MRQIAIPFVLNAQQKEYTLAGYAAFQKKEKIFDEFCACFPEVAEGFQSEYPEDWEQRLMVSIEELYPGHPRFNKELNVLFSGLRRNYLQSVSDSRSGNARVRFAIMDETLDKLDEFMETNPESTLECVRLRIDVLKRASDESYAFFEANVGRAGYTEEEVRALLSKMSPEQVEEFKGRYKEGEHPDKIIMDFEERMLTVTDQPKEESDEKTVTEQTEETQEPDEDSDPPIIISEGEQR